MSGWLVRDESHIKSAHLKLQSKMKVLTHCLPVLNFDFKKVIFINPKNHKQSDIMLDVKGDKSVQF